MGLEPFRWLLGHQAGFWARDFVLQARLLARRLGFEPNSCLEAGIWVNRLGFRAAGWDEPKIWDLDQQTGMQASRLILGP